MPIERSCTTLLVGKKASIDGSTIIARDEDGGNYLWPQQFVIINPEDQPQHYKSEATSVELDLPENPLRYSSTPDAHKGDGIWAAAGINSENVAMTATETITTNSRILGLDPFVEEGLGEADFTTIVLPYIHSAREGVERMGSLLERYGTYESNGMAFSDNNEIWWFETLGGHQWAAVRIPDDAYVIAPNRLNIDKFDFESEDTLYSSGLKEFVDDNFLNPDFNDGEYNLRHIFGSSNQADAVYNNPRAWYAQNYFGNRSDDPRSQELPFICHADRKITIDDVKFVLSSHFEGTEYDQYANRAAADSLRPIGLNRNQEVHILQIRNNVPSNIAGIHWLALAANTFNNVLPFYANVSDTPATYRDVTEEYDFSKMYWLCAATALLGDSNFEHYVDMRDESDLKTMSFFRKVQAETDKLGEEAKESDLLAANEKMAEAALKFQTELFGKMVASGSKIMNLRFRKD